MPNWSIDDDCQTGNVVNQLLAAIAAVCNIGRE